MSKYNYKEIASRFVYQDGSLIRRCNIGNQKKGSIAGYLTKKGYRVVKINQASCLEHIVIWVLLKKRLPTGEIDHINRIKHDNRIENLRDVSKSVNSINRAASDIDSVDILETNKGQF